MSHNEQVFKTKNLQQQTMHVVFVTNAEPMSQSSSVKETIGTLGSTDDWKSVE